MPPHFGASISQKNGLVLQPATGRQPGVIFLVSEPQGCYKLELTDTAFTPHRMALNLAPDTSKNEKEMSSVTLNGLFVNEHMKLAIDKGSFRVHDDLSVTLTYNISGIEYVGLLKGFSQCSFLEMLRGVASEIHRAYDRIHDMIETAANRGLDLKENDTDEVVEAERIQQAELRRKNLSAVNPMMRAKKVAKGFGSK